MDEEKITEIAWGLMVTRLPATWLSHDVRGESHATPKAIRLRDSIVRELRAAYDQGYDAGYANAAIAPQQ